MGQESEAEPRRRAFQSYQVNEQLMAEDHDPRKLRGSTLGRPAVKPPEFAAWLRKDAPALEEQLLQMASEVLTYHDGLLQIFPVLPPWDGEKARRTSACLQAIHLQLREMAESLPAYAEMTAPEEIDRSLADLRARFYHAQRDLKVAIEELEEIAGTRPDQAPN